MVFWVYLSELAWLTMTSCNCCGLLTVLGLRKIMANYITNYVTNYIKTFSNMVLYLIFHDFLGTVLKVFGFLFSFLSSTHMEEGARFCGDSVT